MTFCKFQSLTHSLFADLDYKMFMTEAPVVPYGTECPEGSWVEVNNGAKSYFYNPQTKESRWFLPPQIMHQHIQRYEATVNGTMMDTSNDANTVDETVSRQDSVGHSTGDDSHNNNLADEDGEDGLLDTSWTVKLHPDSGQVFYMDSFNAMSTWHNPFSGGSVSELLDALDQKQMEENEVQEVEKLAGFDLTPNQAVFDRFDNFIFIIFLFENPSLDFKKNYMWK